MKTVKEVSQLAGVTVRTLHHYDAIGLLKPTKVSEAGYRLYDEAALVRLQSILFFRELEFPLKKIKNILDRPDFDWKDALQDQIVLLKMEHRRLEGLIAYASELFNQGETPMNYHPFDNREMEQYKEEVKAKWGKTVAYQEFQQRQGADFQDAGQQLMGILAEFGPLRPLPPEAPAVQKKVQALQDHITAHFYTCTKEILADLGQMYTADDRFRQNIDQAGGEGTAQFINRAIEIYCWRC